MTVIINDDRYIVYDHYYSPNVSVGYCYSNNDPRSILDGIFLILHKKNIFYRIQYKNDKYKYLVYGSERIYGFGNTIKEAYLKFCYAKFYDNWYSISGDIELLNKKLSKYKKFNKDTELPFSDLLNLVLDISYNEFRTNNKSLYYNFLFNGYKFIQENKENLKNKYSIYDFIMLSNGYSNINPIKKFFNIKH